MRLLGLVLAAILLFGCVSQPPGSSSSTSGSDSGNYNPGQNSDDIPATYNENYSKPFWIHPVQDMVVYEGKLYIVGSSGSISTVYQYVDDKTAPKIMLKLWHGDGSFPADDPRFKDRILELTDFVVYGGKLYVGGSGGVFRLNDAGEWEYVEFALGFPSQGFGLYKIKQLGDYMYGAASYFVTVPGRDEPQPTGKVLKLRADKWEEVSTKYDWHMISLTDLAIHKGDMYLVEDSGAVYKYNLTSPDAPEYFWINDYDSAAPVDQRVNIDRFGKLGSDGAFLYACGEGAELYSYDGQWKALKEMGDTCTFFKTVDGALFFGTQGDGKVGASPESPGEMGLFQVAEGKVQKIADGIDDQNKRTAVGSVAMYGGKLIVGGDNLYKITGGRLEKIQFYEPG